MNFHGYEMSGEGTANTMPKKKDFKHPFLFRFRDKEKYLYIARLSYFREKAIQHIFDDHIFRREWSLKNDDLKKNQKKLGISDEQLLARLKDRKYRL